MPRIAAIGSSFINFGWALTPQPKLIPMDGSTIDVIIDGVRVGGVTAYNCFRSDVSTLFTGLKNSAGVLSAIAPSIRLR